MTGLERLRSYAEMIARRFTKSCDEGLSVHGNDCKGITCFKCARDVLTDIADQIEREHAQTVEDHERQQQIIRDLQRERDEALRDARSANAALGEIKKWASDFMWDNRDDAYLKRQGSLVSRMCERVDDSSEGADSAKLVRDHGGLDRISDMAVELWKNGMLTQSMQNIEDELKDGVNTISTKLGIHDEIQGLKIAEVCPRVCDEIDRIMDCLHENEAIVSSVVHRVWPDGSPEEGVDAYEVAHELDRRLMPSDYEWPRFEDGEPVRIGDELEHKEQGHRFKVDVIEFMADGWRACCENDAVRDVYRPGERVKSPSPKVLDADGAEIRVGDDLYGCESGRGPFKVVETLEDSSEVKLKSYLDGSEFTTCAATFTHRAPVLAADGSPLREGERVWNVHGGGPYVVTDINQETGSIEVTCNTHDGQIDWGFYALELTHEDPLETPRNLTHEQPDSWERLEEDAEKDPCSYFGFDGEETCGKCPASEKNCEQTMALDLVLRAKALAERERGER